MIPAKDNCDEKLQYLVSSPQSVNLTRIHLSGILISFNFKQSLLGIIVGAIVSGGNSVSKTAKRLDTLPTKTGGVVDKKYLYSRITTIIDDTTTPMETLKQELRSSKRCNRQ